MAHILVNSTSNCVEQQQLKQVEIPLAKGAMCGTW